MLADRRELIRRLTTQGASVAGQHWAMLTAEVLLVAYSPPLPYVFPGLLRDAESLCEEAGATSDHAQVMYLHAETTWNQLLGPKRRQPS